MDCFIAVMLVWLLYCLLLVRSGDQGERATVK